MIAPSPQADRTQRLAASHQPSRAIAQGHDEQDRAANAVLLGEEAEGYPQFQRRTRSRNGPDRRRLERGLWPGDTAKFTAWSTRERQRRRGRRARASRKAAQRSQFAQRLGVARTDVREIGRCRRWIEIAPRARAFTPFALLDHDRDVRQIGQAESVLGPGGPVSTAMSEVMQTSAKSTPASASMCSGRER